MTWPLWVNTLGEGASHTTRNMTVTHRMAPSTRKKGNLSGVSAMPSSSRRGVWGKELGALCPVCKKAAYKLAGAKCSTLSYYLWTISGELRRIPLPRLSEKVYEQRSVVNLTAIGRAKCTEKPLFGGPQGCAEGASEAFRTVSIRGSYRGTLSGAQPPPVPTFEISIDDELARLTHTCLSSSTD